jgi:hypothetical protein
MLFQFFKDEMLQAIEVARSAAALPTSVMNSRLSIDENT